VIQTEAYNPARLSEILATIRDVVKFCAVCGNVSQEQQCSLCRDPRRARDTICVVEEAKDVVAIERTRQFKGLYHVLGGAISPIDGIGPDQLRIGMLLERLRDSSVVEIILATDPNVEGEATATYLIRLLEPLGIRITRLASGLPVGGDLEYADEITLGRAFQHRTWVSGT
jgi:recombination protein RecR